MSNKRSDILEQVHQALKGSGIDLDRCCSGEGAEVKVVCIDADLGQSLAAVGSAPRDQVVMVRLDRETSEKLDAWTQTGAVRSRSEAAALFIREGLKVRATELERLKGAIDQVQKAKARLREKAREVLGETV